jgi:hypothetical protein
VEQTKIAFVSNHIANERYVWDPKVHYHLYDEQCCYFLLRLRNPDNTLIENIKDLILKEGIVSFCYYSLYGYYDVLVRMWAATHKRTRFINALERLRDNIESISEFQARDINYSWTRVKPEQVIHYKKDIEKIAAAANEGKAIDQSILDKLINLGIVHCLKSTGEKSIKFYIALTKIPGTSSAPFEYRHLTESLQKDHLSLQNVSVYAGIGFASYLVKAVAAEYRNILESTTKMLEFLRPLSLRPTTLLIANNDAWESDLIDLEWDKLPKNLAQLDLLLGSAAADAAARLDPHVQHELSVVFDQFRDLLSTPLSPVFKELMLARLENNPIAFVEKLSFIMRLEGLLRKYFVEESAANLGPSWFETCKKMASECNINPSDKAPNAYSMHDLVAMLNKLVNSGCLPAEKVHEALGPDWFDQLKNIPKLRNDFAHSRLYEDPKIFDRWSQIVKDALAAGQVYNRLVERYMRTPTI